MDNVFLIDKPAGWTSFDVVAKIRGELSKKEGKRVKVGHAGTLDPFATGLLIVLTFDATKKQDEYMKKDKEYEATLKLGYTSTTGDPEGEITPAESAKREIKEEEINKVLKDFLGETEQTPPIHSAIKVNGQRAYKLARAGKEVKLKPRTIVLYSIEVLDYSYPLLTIRIKCSSGTYIRTLAEDIGEKLGSGAYLTALRRTKIGDFDIKDALTIEDATGVKSE